MLPATPLMSTLIGFLKSLALAGLFWMACLHGASASTEVAPLLIREYPAPVVNLGPHAEFFVDSSASLEISQVVSEPWSREFQPSSASPPSFGFTRAAVWMRCEILAESPQAVPLTVALASARIGRIDWFVIDEGRVIGSLAGGSSIPASFPARHSTIHLEIPGGTSRTLYARVASDTAILLPFIAGSPEAMQRFETYRAAFDLMLIGFCIAATAFLSMLGITQRQPMFFYLAVFAAAYSGYYTIFHGHVVKLWPERPFWIERGGFGFVSAVGMYSFIRFNRAYLDLRTMARHEQFLQRAAESLLLIGAILFLFIDFQMSMRILHLLMAVGVILASSVIVLRARHHRNREEVWFFLAWIVYGVCVAMIALKSTQHLTVGVPLIVLQQFLIPAILAAFFLVAAARQRSLQRLEIQLAEAEALRSRAIQERDAKGLFLANVSHEIRTPLSALVGLSQAMWLRCESIGEDSEFTRFLNRVRSGGHYLGLLLRNVLNVTAAESGRVPVRSREFYLADWIGEVRNILEPLADYHRGSIEWFPPAEDEFRFRTDEMRLTQILLNLAENALKFGAESGVPVTIRLEKTASGLRMSVEDRGPGISAECLDSVFSEFEQADSQSSPMATGAGLGLAVVKLNTTLLGGSLAVERRPSGGMRFTVEIPDTHESNEVNPADAATKELPTSATL
jgi:signal transduction histidine kinase